MPVAITKWKTRDGKEFSSELEANAHEDFCRLARYFPTSKGLRDAHSCSSQQNNFMAQRVYEVLTCLLRGGYITITMDEGPDRG
jgi:hypothetical protein